MTKNTAALPLEHSTIFLFTVYVKRQKVNSVATSFKCRSLDAFSKDIYAAIFGRPLPRAGSGAVSKWVICACDSLVDFGAV